MRLLLASGLALFVASPVRGATVRVVSWRAGAATEAQALAVTRAAEQALRELSTLVIQPASRAEKATRSCPAEDAGCWSELAGGATTDFGLVMIAGGSGGLSVDMALVDLKERRVERRRLAATSAEGASRAAREAVEALLPRYLRRGFGGVRVDMPSGARLKVDGELVLAEPSLAPLALRPGPHEVDLLLPGGMAVLRKEDVVEGRLIVSRFDVGPPEETPSGGALRATSAALWSAGTVAVVASLALGALGNARASYYRTQCTAGTTCITLDEAIAERRRVEGLMGTANVLLWSGGALALAGAGVFTFDLVQERR